MADYNLGSASFNFGVEGFEGLSNSINAVNNMSQGMTQTFNNAGEAAQNLGQDISNTTDQASEQQTVFDGLRGTFQSVANVPLLSYLNTINLTLIDLAENLTYFHSFQNIMGALRLQISNVGVMLQNLFGSSMVSIVMGLAGTFSTLMAVIAPLIALAYTLHEVWQFNIGNIQGAWIQAWGNIQQAFIDFEMEFRNFLQRIEPLIRTVFIPLINFVEGFVTGMLQGFEDIITVINVFRQAFQPIIDFFGLLVGRGEEANSIFGQLGGAIARIAVWVGSFAAIYKIAMGIITAIGYIVSYLNPITGTILAIISVFTILYNRFEGFRDFVQSILDILIQIGEVIGDIFTLGFGDFGDEARRTNEVVRETRTNQRNIQNNNEVKVYTSGNMNKASAERVGSGLLDGIMKSQRAGE